MSKNGGWRNYSSFGGFSLRMCVRRLVFSNSLLHHMISQNSEIATSPNVGPEVPNTGNADLTDYVYDSKVEGNIIITRVDAAINWMRKNSLWPMPMGLACCAIELMATASSRFDISRFGAEVMRFSPRQADVMIVSGTVTYKMALAVKRIWDQMPEPKWCMAMGACASSGGMFRSYATLQGIDRLIPVDVYISGCPPRPEALIEGLMKLQEKIDTEHSTKGLKADPEVKPVKGLEISR